jgi:xanthine dehydrogenase molybdopterin-binding subunit B
MNSKSEQFMTLGAAKGWSEVGQSHPHESAILHVLGEAVYTDDIPEAQGTLHKSARAHPFTQPGAGESHARRGRRVHVQGHPGHQRLRSDHS